MLCSYVADALRSSSHEEVMGADRGLIGLLAWVGLVVLTSGGIQDRARLDTLMRRLIVMATVVAALGYYDFFTSTNIADSINIPGLHASTTGISAMDRGSFTRPRSTTAQPLEFGGMLSILLPFAIQQAFDPIRAHLHLVRRWGPVVIMAGALPLTVSRTSIIGIVLVLAVMVGRWRPQRRWTAIGVITASVGAFKMIIPGLIGTIINLFSSFLSNSDSSTQARTVKYSEILPYLTERPLFGRGFGTFTPDLYFFTDNQYMLSAAEMGACGLIALLTLYLTGIHQGGSIRRLARTESDRELGQAFFASALVALVISATFDALSFAMFAGMFFLTLGAGGRYLAFVRADAEAATAPRRSPPAFPDSWRAEHPCRRPWPSSPSPGTVPGCSPASSPRWARAWPGSTTGSWSSPTTTRVDDTVQQLRELAPYAVVVQTGRNAGYAAAINAALATPQAAACDVVLVCNPDVRMRPGCAAALAEELGEALPDGSRVGISVPCLYEEDGRTRLDSLRREPSVGRAFGEALIGNRRAGRFPALSEIVTDPAAYARPTVADWATGALMAISRACLEACGPWDESFFLYSEETEYCLRARDLGLATRLQPRASAVHLGGDSQFSPAVDPARPQPGPAAPSPPRRPRLRRVPLRGAAARGQPRAPRPRPSRAAAAALLSNAALRATPGP